MFALVQPVCSGTYDRCRPRGAFIARRAAAWLMYPCAAIAFNTCARRASAFWGLATGSYRVGDSTSPARRAAWVRLSLAGGTGKEDSEGTLMPYAWGLK